MLLCCNLTPKKEKQSIGTGGCGRHGGVLSARPVGNCSDTWEVPLIFPSPTYLLEPPIPTSSNMPDACGLYRSKANRLSCTVLKMVHLLRLVASLPLIQKLIQFPES